MHEDLYGENIGYTIIYETYRQIPNILVNAGICSDIVLKIAGFGRGNDSVFEDTTEPQPHNTVGKGELSFCNTLNSMIMHMYLNPKFSGFFFFLQIHNYDKMSLQLSTFST